MHFYSEDIYSWSNIQNQLVYGQTKSEFQNSNNFQTISLKKNCDNVGLTLWTQISHLNRLIGDI